jgi:hypothetical protein
LQRLLWFLSFVAFITPASSFFGCGCCGGCGGGGGWAYMPGQTTYVKVPIYGIVRRPVVERPV